MPNLNLVTRIHVLTAIRVHDQVGAAEFLAEQGAEVPGDTVVVERGRRYDGAALLAFAYAKATGTPITAGEVATTAATVLGKLDFTVTSVADLTRPTAKRTATPRVSRAKVAAKPEPVVAICPKCFMQLPATGVCDYCD